MILAAIVILVSCVVLAVVTGLSLKAGDTELERLAYWDAYWGFYDTAGDPDKALASIEPDLKIAALSIMSAVGLVKNRYELRAFEGRRTLTRQRKLYYKGTGTRLPYKHAFGFAVDLVPWDTVKKKWDWAAILYCENPIKTALRAFSYVTWGGTWGKVDKYHFELERSPVLYTAVKNTLSKEGLA